MAEADLVDLSGYASDTNEPPGQVNSVTASAVMDVTEEGEEDTSPSLTDLYDADELRKRGINYVLGEADDDEDLLINRCAGNFRKLLAAPSVSEEEAAETIHQLYPEIFGEGFTVGYKKGVEDQEDLENDQESEEDAEPGEIDELKTKLRRAANLIANIRAFLMAAMITHEIGEVEEYWDASKRGTVRELVFSKKLEDFLAVARGFDKTDSELVRDLFQQKDLALISEGISRLAQKIEKTGKKKKQSSE
jgi:hypothetical protein